MAIADLSAWRDTVATRLPGGAAGTSFMYGAPGTPAVYLVEVNWHEGGAAAEIAYRLRVEIAEAPR